MPYPEVLKLSIDLRGKILFIEINHLLKSDIFNLPLIEMVSWSETKGSMDKKGPLHAHQLTLFHQSVVVIRDLWTKWKDFTNVWSDKCLNRKHWNWSKSERRLSNSANDGWESDFKRSVWLNPCRRSMWSPNASISSKVTILNVPSSHRISYRIKQRPRGSTKRIIATAVVYDDYSFQFDRQ